MRPAMSQYVFFDVEPPIRDIIATSILYIYLAPLISASGILLALSYTLRNKSEIKALTLSFLLGIGFMVFSFWFEVNLFEGVSFLG